MSNNNYPITDEYSIKQVTDLAEFEKLRTIWDNLAEKQGPYMPFLCFDWFNMWLGHFLKGDKLLIVLLYKEHEMIAIAPFLIKTERYKGININKIELIGNVYSPFRYFLFSELNDEERIRSLSSIFQFLFKDYKNWDVLDLSGIPEEKKCFEILKMAVKQRSVKYADLVCYGDWYLDGIEYSSDEYFLNLPQKIRKDVAYCRRRLENMGNFEFKLITDGDMIDHYMNLYYGVYAKSWQEREGIGPNFHRDLAKVTVKNGWLRLGFLFLDNYPIASQIWVSCNKAAFILKTVYSQEFKKYSPGKVLTTEMMKYVIDTDRVQMVDYVQGDETYKQDWTPKRRERKGILVFNKTFKGYYLNLLIIKVLPLFQRNGCLNKFKLFVSRKILRINPT